jgi:hypothetical protein
MNLRIEDFSANDVRQLPAGPRSNQRLARQTEPFLKGPIPLSWLVKAASLKRAALAAGICLWFHRGVAGQTRVRVSAGVRKKMGLSAPQMRRGLSALAGVGLIRFEKSGRGRCAVVDIIELPAPTGDSL